MGPQGLNVGPGANGQVSLLASRLLAAAKPVAIVAATPAQALAGTGNGILIIGNSNSPWPAAIALLAAMGVR
jgi:hypothetical protein